MRNKTPRHLKDKKTVTENKKNVEEKEKKNKNIKSEKKKIVPEKEQEKNIVTEKEQEGSTQNNQEGSAQNEQKGRAQNEQEKNTQNEKKNEGLVVKNKTELKATIKIPEQKEATSEEIKIRKKCRIKLIICLVYAIAIMIYFISMNIINSTSAEKFNMYIKISYIVLILLTIVMFEIYYKKQNKSFLISGIEFLALALHTLLLERTITLFNLTGKVYILATSCIWPIYFCLKGVIIQTKESRRRLKQISDIQEILKEEKPIKKVAKKRKK